MFDVFFHIINLNIHHENLPFMKKNENVEKFLTFFSQLGIDSVPGFLLLSLSWDKGTVQWDKEIFLSQDIPRPWKPLIWAPFTW